MRRNDHASILAPRPPCLCLRCAYPLRLMGAALAAAIGAGLAVGCGGSPPAKTLHNPDPSGKIPAIKDAVRRGDRRAAAQLIKDLESDDPAVRFYASEGLRRLTGETFGYRYFDPDEERQVAVERWQGWMAAQTNPGAQPVPTSTASTPSPLP
jgi:hypothetical protein